LEATVSETEVTSTLVPFETRGLFSLFRYQLKEFRLVATKRGSIARLRKGALCETVALTEAFQAVGSSFVLLLIKIIIVRLFLLLGITLVLRATVGLLKSALCEFLIILESYLSQ
jgi:hypothetical protein